MNDCLWIAIEVVGCDRCSCMVGIADYGMCDKLKMKKKMI